VTFGSRNFSLEKVSVPTGLYAGYQ